MKIHKKIKMWSPRYLHRGMFVEYTSTGNEKTA